MANLKDSGARRDFGTGAVRDISEGKGRCDLLPLYVIGSMTHNDIFNYIEKFRRTNDIDCLHKVIKMFVVERYDDVFETALLELSIHYEDGARKYSDRNWENGIPLHCFIDSAVRHYLKYHRGDTDEPHDRAFLWNIFGAIWTYHNHPELDDYTIKEKK